MKRTHEDEDFPEFGVRIGTYLSEYVKRDRGFCGVLCKWWDSGTWGLEDGYWLINSSRMRACAALLDYLNIGGFDDEDAKKWYSNRAVFHLPEVIESEA